MASGLHTSLPALFRGATSERGASCACAMSALAHLMRLTRSVVAYYYVSRVLGLLSEPTLQQGSARHALVPYRILQ